MSWSSLPLSFLGRSNRLKMSILPKFTFIFDTIPLEFNLDAIKKLQGNLCSFIWSAKGVRMRGRKFVGGRYTGE